ncbi:TlpA family protein disulfide reductase [Rubrolithibacter danxiaensis]|uniref:TlpA family protein disulfide reductase n=1 Tax=Rubrolithibacter danxiaensis TaxID=3390805 RepID=UPI003BF88796
MNLLKSNLGFIISLVLIAVVAFNPEVKAVVLQGLIRTGLFQPSVQPLKSGSSASEKNTYSVPSIYFKGTDGKTIDLAALKGKVVFLNFWAKWCPPCRAEMPAINSLYNKFKNNSRVVFILVDADGNLEKSGAFMKKKNYSLPVYISASNVPEQLFSGSLPTTHILNKKAELVFSHEGMADYDSPEMVKFIEGLLKQ